MLSSPPQWLRLIAAYSHYLGLYLIPPGLPPVSAVGPGQAGGRLAPDGLSLDLEWSLTLQHTGIDLLTWWLESLRERAEACPAS